MKILVIVHALPTGGGGGVEAVAWEQASELRRRGHSVRILVRSSSAEQSLAEGAWRDAEIELNSVREVGHEVGAPPSWRSLLHNDSFDAALDDLLDSFAPDLVHVQHLVHLSMSLVARVRARRIPVVVSLHDFFFLCDRLFLLDEQNERCEGPDEGRRCIECLSSRCAEGDATWRYQLGQEVLHEADAVVAPSRSFAQAFLRASGNPQLPVEVIEPGIDFRPVKRRPREAGAPLRLLYVGALLPHKGIDLLVDAVCGIEREGWELVIRGRGEAGNAFESAMRERTAGLPVHWGGPFDAHEAPAIYRHSDVLVIPSRCIESWSRVAREARAAGCAVVAPLVGGPADFLQDDRDAILVPPGSAEQLAAGLRLLLDRPALLNRITAARTEVASVGDAIDRLEVLFGRILAGR